MEKINGMITCHVCGRNFPLVEEEHYVARDPVKKGIVSVISGQVEATQYDAIDCPHCGCQNILQERKLEHFLFDFDACGYEAEVEEEEN